MTQPNQSELEQILYTYRFDSQAVDEDLVLQQDTVRVEEAHLDNLKEVTDYITANYTPKVHMQGGVHMANGHDQLLDRVEKAMVERGLPSLDVHEVLSQIRKGL